jgi:hypothetical protein
MINDTSNWALYYKAEEGVPREFLELRCLGSTVWTRSGAVGTWGAGGPAEYGRPEEAQAEFRTANEQALETGRALTREGRYDPARFDWKQLRTEIREGARQAFAAVQAAHPGKPLCGFALATDGSAMTIGPMATSKEALEEAGGEDDFRFNPDEWPYYEGGEFLDIAYRLILPRHQDVPQDLPFEEFQEGVFEAAVLALSDLAEEGVFGDEQSRDDFFLLLHVTDDDPLVETVARLNTPAMAARYQAWWESWN